MPRDGNSVYSKPAGTTAVLEQTIEPTLWNTMIDDLVADANLDRPIAAGGTGASTAAQARANLGAASLNENETLGGAKTFSGAVTFQGATVVPNSTTGTHALNVTTADARYVSTTGSATVNYTGQFNVVNQATAGGNTDAVTLGVRQNGTAGIWASQINATPGNSFAAGILIGSTEIGENVHAFANWTWYHSVPTSVSNPTTGAVAFATLHNAAGGARYSTGTDVATKTRADAAYAPISSSLRYKENAATVEHPASVDALGPLMAWTWGGELCEDDRLRGRDGWGLIAEHAVKAIPEAAVYDHRGELVGLQSLPLISLLVQEIRDLKDRVAALEARS